ncbi:MAG: hypothetical protein QXE92_00415 [Thermofilaceae archaeon]
MESVSIPKEVCMKISFQEDPKVMEIFKGLPPIFRIEKSDDTVIVYCPIGYEISRHFYKMKVREFYRVYKALKVEGGRKIWKYNTIILEPKKTKSLRIQISPGEFYLYKVAAERAGETLSDYIRTAAFTRMARDLGL